MPSSSDPVIDFIEQSESRPSASMSATKSQFTMFPSLKLGVIKYTYLKIRSRLAKIFDSKFSPKLMHFSPYLSDLDAFPYPSKSPDRMNPVQIKILLTHDFDFNGFSRYGRGAFYGIMPMCLYLSNDIIRFISCRMFCKVYCQLSCCIITIFIG